MSYGPADDPDYVIAVYVEQAGHGGTTSAPIARQIWEGIAALEGVQGFDQNTEVSLGSDGSGPNGHHLRRGSRPHRRQPITARMARKAPIRHLDPVCC